MAQTGVPHQVPIGVPSSIATPELQTVEPVLISQLATAFDPHSLNQSDGPIFPYLVDLGIQTFTPGITPPLIQPAVVSQPATAMAISVAMLIDPALVDQSITVFDPTLLVVGRFYPEVVLLMTAAPAPSFVEAHYTGAVAITQPPGLQDGDRIYAWSGNTAQAGRSPANDMTALFTELNWFSWGGSGPDWDSWMGYRDVPSVAAEPASYNMAWNGSGSHGPVFIVIRGEGGPPLQHSQTASSKMEFLTVPAIVAAAGSQIGWMWSNLQGGTPLNEVIAGVTNYVPTGVHGNFIGFFMPDAVEAGGAISYAYGRINNWPGDDTWLGVWEMAAGFGVYDPVVADAGMLYPALVDLGITTPNPGINTIRTDLVQQLVVAYDPQVTPPLLPAVVSQPATTFDPVGIVAIGRVYPELVRMLTAYPSPVYISHELGVGTTVNRPTGADTGDILFIWTGNDNGIGAPFTRTGDHSLFTLLGFFNYGGPGTDWASYAGYRVIDDIGTEPASYDMTWSGTGGRPPILILIRGANAPLQSDTRGGQNTFEETVAVPAIVAAANSQIAWFWSNIFAATPGADSIAGVTNYTADGNLVGFYMPDELEVGGAISYTFGPTVYAFPYDDGFLTVWEMEGGWGVYDPTVFVDPTVYPVLVSQLATAFTISLTPPLVQPAVVQVITRKYDPVVSVAAFVIGPLVLVTQTATAFAPELRHHIYMDLVQQLTVAQSTTVVPGAVILYPATVYRLVVGYDAGVNVGRPVEAGDITIGKVFAVDDPLHSKYHKFPEFVHAKPVAAIGRPHSVSVGSAAALNPIDNTQEILVPLFKEHLVEVFEVSVIMKIDPAVVSQPATAYDPSSLDLYLRLYPAVVSMAIIAYAVSVIMKIDPVVVSQPVTAYAPSIVT